MKKKIDAANAPAAIGNYSPAIQCGKTIYFSGQIPLDPDTMELVQGDVRAQIVRVFENLRIVAEAAGGALDSIVKLTVYLTDISHVVHVNEVMGKVLQLPFPARTTIQVSKLPKNAEVEIDAIMVCDEQCS